MKDVVVDGIIYVDEKSYQQMKKDMNKSDNYFDIEEVKILKNKKSNVIITLK